MSRRHSLSFSTFALLTVILFNGVAIALTTCLPQAATPRPALVPSRYVIDFNQLARHRIRTRALSASSRLWKISSLSVSKQHLQLAIPAEESAKHLLDDTLAELSHPKDAFKGLRVINDDYQDNGFAMLDAGQFLTRETYSHVARLFLHADDDFNLSSSGKRLYERMLRVLQDSNYVQAVVAADPSELEHRNVLRSVGFDLVVTLRKINYKDSEMKDVEFWMKSLQPVPTASVPADIFDNSRPIATRIQSNRQLSFRPAKHSDAAMIREIYRHYVEDNYVAPEIVCPSVQEIQNRMGTFELPWIVAVDSEGEIVGYCCATKFLEYDRTAMCSIYISSLGQGQGLGWRLYEEVLDALKLLGYGSVVIMANPNNEATIKLHEKVGFVHAGRMEGLNYKFGYWTPRVFMQYHLLDAHKNKAE